MSSPESDRNLLFAVLALQADCLTPARFVEACTLWAGRKDTPIAELLVERGWLTPDERADVERLVERKLRKHAGDARAAVAEATADAPVRESLAAVPDPDVQALTSMGTLAEDPARAARAAAASAGSGLPGAILLSGGEDPGGAGRFTLTSLHATGGIGRVWLAHDAAVGRDVALKDLRPERAGNPVLAERFLREARVTGQLEHPGIVPIYELGRRPGTGEPFYVMRFVRGRTLREAAAEYHRKRERGELGPLDLRELLGAFVGVCNAVAYAHSRKVIHRDLKPANVVLGEFGEVMVLDWGLAKELRPDAAPTSRPDETTDLSSLRDLPEGPGTQTREGEVLGTPAYMAPEQADGRLADLDVRTDVYGLGAILYEILTGRPPFGGETTAEVLDRVRVAPPDRPRAVVPDTPRPLEAVCLKALAKRPADRHPTAADLARDVQRFLADEPTSAYREPLPARAARWARRHRTLVTSLVAVLAVAVPILLAAVVLLERSESREQAARRRAEANYGRSLRAADALSEELARGIRPIAGTQAKTVVSILDRAKQISDDLLADPDAPPEAVERRAALLIQFAELYRDTNRTGAARQVSAQAIELYDRLLAADPGSKRLRVGRARANHRLGWTLMDQAYEDEALRHLRACIDELEAVGTDDDPILAATVLASAYTISANLLVGFGEHDDAARLYDRGLEIRRRVLAVTQGNVEARVQLAVGLERIGLFEAKYRAKAKGTAALREAREELAALCRERPWDAALHLHLVRMSTSFAEAGADDAEVAAVLKANQAVVDRFTQLDPDHLIWFREGVRLKHYVVRAKMKDFGLLDPPEQAALWAEEVRVTTENRDAARRTTELDPDNGMWLADWANFEGRLAAMHVRRSRFAGWRAGFVLAAARDLAHSSAARYDEVLRRSPRCVDHHLGKFFAMAQLARAELDPAARAVARWDYAAAEVGLYQPLAAKYPANTHWQSQLALAYFRAASPLRLAVQNPDWGVLTRPEVAAALVRLAGQVADRPPGLPDSQRKRAEVIRADLGVLLRGLDDRGALPADGKAILAKFPPPG